MMIRKTSLIQASVFVTLALCALLAAGVTAIFYLLLAVGTFFAIQGAYQLVYRPRSSTIFSVFKLTFLLGYCLGTAISAWFFRIDPSVSQYALVGPFAFNGYSVELSYSLATVFAVAGVLAFLDGLSRPVLKIGRFAQPDPLSRVDRMLVTFWLFVLLMAYAQGDIGYMGPTASAQGHISFLGGLAGIIAPPLLATATYALFSSPERRTDRLFFGAVVIITFLLLIPLGRRIVIYSTLVSLAVAVYAAPGLAKKLAPRKIVFSPTRWIRLSIVLFIIILSLYFFYAIRMATLRLGDTSDLTMRIKSATRVLIAGKDFFGLASAQSSARTGTLLGYLGKLEHSRQQPYLGGAVLGGNIVISIPSIFLPGKERLMRQLPNTDEAINARFGLPPTDSPTSLLTQGYVDFGVIGPFIYVLLVAFLYWFVLLHVAQIRIASLRILSYSALIYSALSVEQSASFFFTTIRNLLIVVVVSYGIWVVLRSAPAFSLRNKNHRA